MSKVAARSLHCFCRRNMAIRFPPSCDSIEVGAFFSHSPLSYDYCGQGSAKITSLLNRCTSDESQQYSVLLPFYRRTASYEDFCFHHLREVDGLTLRRVGCFDHLFSNGRIRSLSLRSDTAGPIRLVCYAAFTCRTPPVYEAAQLIVRLEARGRTFLKPLMSF